MSRIEPQGRAMFHRWRSSGHLCDSKKANSCCVYSKELFALAFFQCRGITHWSEPADLIIDLAGPPHALLLLPVDIAFKTLSVNRDLMIHALSIHPT